VDRDAADLLPDQLAFAGVSVLEATPAGHAGAIPEFLRHLLPGDPGPQHEQDAGKGATVIDPFPNGMVEATLPHR
jgi:hypothetical protein